MVFESSLHIPHYGEFLGKKQKLNIYTFGVYKEICKFNLHINYYAESGMKPVYLIIIDDTF